MQMRWGICGGLIRRPVGDRNIISPFQRSILRSSDVVVSEEDFLRLSLPNPVGQSNPYQPCLVEISLETYSWQYLTGTPILNRSR